MLQWFKFNDQQHIKLTRNDATWELQEFDNKFLRTINRFHKTSGGITYQVNGMPQILSF